MKSYGVSRSETQSLLTFNLSEAPMCLAIPGKIKSIDKKTRHARVSFSGMEKDINIEVVDVNIGDYVIVHAGYAIEKLGKQDASEVLALLNKDAKSKK